MRKTRGVTLRRTASFTVIIAFRNGESVNGSTAETGRSNDLNIAERRRPMMLFKICRLMPSCNNQQQQQHRENAERARSTPSVRPAVKGICSSAQLDTHRRACSDRCLIPRACLHVGCAGRRLRFRPSSTVNLNLPCLVDLDLHVLHSVFELLLFQRKTVRGLSTPTSKFSTRIAGSARAVGIDFPRPPTFRRIEHWFVTFY